MTQKRYVSKLGIILALTIFGLLIPTNDSFAKNPAIIGFMIEASQMEGTIKEINMTTGDTIEQKNQPMLEMKFENLHADRLVIKKIVKTPEGLISIDMTPEDSVDFNNLRVKVTNAEMAEPYLPENGNIGLKNVKLLAHYVTTDSSILPKLNVKFSGSEKIEMEPKNEEGLIQLKTAFEQIISDLGP